MDELIAKLKELGLSEEQTKKLTEQGLVSADDLAGLTTQELMSMTDCGLFLAKRVIAAFAPAPVAAPAAPVAEAGAPVSDVVPEGANPSTAQMSNFASQFGIPSDLLGMIMAGNMVAAGTGVDFDFGSMVPIGNIASSYSPKIRNMTYLFMDKIQKSLGNVPIVVINADGSVNADMTAKYVLSLQEGYERAEEDIYYDDDGNPHELIKVGVDAQSVYDADPLDSVRALQKNGMGLGRINWNKIPLDVRQMVFLAVNDTGEVRSDDTALVSRLRDKIKAGVSRMDLQGDMPKAYGKYNEKARTGALPTLRVQISNAARRPEIMSRRRSRTEGGQPGTGSGFRSEDDNG